MAKDLIQVTHGLKADLPQLMPGEIGFCTDTEEAFIGNGDGNANIPLGAKGDKGDNGADGTNGVTYTPHVSDDGTLSWTNDGGLNNPDPVNIKGATGPVGADGTDGIDGTTFTPHVSADGVLSWTNDGGKENPNNVNLFTDLIQKLPEDGILRFNSSSPACLYVIRPEFISHMPTIYCYFAFASDGYRYDDGNSNIYVYTFDLYTGKHYRCWEDSTFNLGTKSASDWKEI